MTGPDDVTVGDAAAHDPNQRSTRGRFGSSTLVWVVAVVAIGIVAGLAGVVLHRSFGRRRDECGSHRAVDGGARDRIPRRPTALADSGETFYWAGVRSGTRIELTAPDGTVFIRYLPPGEPAGSTAPALTVATYPRSNAFDEVSRAAEGENVTKLDLPGGGVASVDETSGTNVHLAYPDQPYQVEVYSPQVGEARNLVANGTIRAFS